MTVDPIAVVRGVVPFSRLTSEELAELVQQLELATFGPQTTIFDDGDPIDDVFVIVEGQVDAVKDGRVIAEMFPGAVVGELALLTAESRRTASARSAAQTSLLRWPADDFRRRLDDGDPVATKVAIDLAHLLAERLKRRTEELVRMHERLQGRPTQSEFEQFKEQMMTEAFL